AKRRCPRLSKDGTQYIKTVEKTHANGGQQSQQALQAGNDTLPLFLPRVRRVGNLSGGQSNKQLMLKDEGQRSFEHHAENHELSKRTQNGKKLNVIRRQLRSISSGLS